MSEDTQGFNGNSPHDVNSKSRLHHILESLSTEWLQYLNKELVLDVRKGEKLTDINRKCQL